MIHECAHEVFTSLAVFVSDQFQIVQETALRICFGLGFFLFGSKPASTTGPILILAWYRILFRFVFLNRFSVFKPSLLAAT